MSVVYLIYLVGSVGFVDIKVVFEILSFYLGLWVFYYLDGEIGVCINWVIWQG